MDGSGMIRIDVDRDSVAMGDDAISHRRHVDLPAGALLSELLEAVAPDIRAAGWSWLADVDGRAVAVWSVDHGVRLLGADRRVAAGDLSVRFRYFLQIDPAWLFDRLAAGAPADRQLLSRQYAPIAARLREAELRRREQGNPERLLGAECVAALVRLGAVVDLHADDEAWLRVAELGDERWTIRRADTMTLVFAPDHPGPVASFRPREVVEPWLVAAVGAHVRRARGLPLLPRHRPAVVPGMVRRGTRWFLDGPVVVQVEDGWPMAVLRFAHGRSVPRIVALLTRRRRWRPRQESNPQPAG